MFIIISTSSQNQLLDHLGMEILKLLGSAMVNFPSFSSPYNKDFPIHHTITPLESFYAGSQFRLTVCDKLSCRRQFGEFRLSAVVDRGAVRSNCRVPNLAKDSLLISILFKFTHLIRLSKIHSVILFLAATPDEFKSQLFSKERTTKGKNQGLLVLRDG